MDASGSAPAPSSHPAAPGVPARLDRQRGPARCGGDRRAGVGQFAGRRHVRTILANHHLDRVRHVGSLRGPPLLGERRPDGPVLPRGRSGDQAGVPDRGAPRPSGGGAPRDRGRRRDGGAGPDLPGDQRRWRGSARLGHRDADRHRVHVGDPRIGIEAGTAGLACVRPLPGDRGRHPHVRDDRDLLSDERRRRPAPRRGRSRRGDVRVDAFPCPYARRVRRARRRDMGGAARFRGAGSRLRGW